MATSLTPIDQINALIEAKKNFVLNGGAGSGKTRTLLDVISLVQSKKEGCKIACITFTNVAADEITARMANKDVKLTASTIHDFLWGRIKSYQKNLKQILIELIKNGEISYKGDQTLNEDWFKNKSIDYREWKKLEEGIISHDEVLKLAGLLFKRFPLLSAVIRDQYDFILIDEYQDTEKRILDIFLEDIQKTKSPPIIGLFGDPMQSIYDKGIGDVNDYKSKGVIHEVQKEDNWRCPPEVIALINKLRTDGLQQKSAKEGLHGKITFIYSNKDEVDLDAVKKTEVFKDFNFENPTENKELYLTHKLIAKQFGFVNLLNSYEYSDNLLGDKPDKLAKHLYKIQEIVSLYNDRKYNEFIRATDYKIKKGSDKKLLKQSIENLDGHLKKTIEEVVNEAARLGLVIKDDSFETFVSTHEEQYTKVKGVPYNELVNIYTYRSSHSPYSTQHGVKGAEFDNVFVLLDNGKWNNYSFEHLFEENKDKESVVNRTRKILYVCCSRAKRNLVVFFHKPSAKVLTKAKEWFGNENVVELT